MNSRKHDLGLLLASSLRLSNKLGIKFQRFVSSLSVVELQQIEERLCEPLAKQLGTIGGIFDKYVSLREAELKKRNVRRVSSLSSRQS